MNPTIYRRLHVALTTARSRAVMDQEKENNKSESISNGDAPLPIALTCESSSGENTTNLYKLLNDLGIPQKIKLAMTGNKSARALLIQERNPQISLAVLGNNRITEQEIADFARNTNIDQKVLRTIARNNSWVRIYEIKRALCFNPKVPLDVAMPLLKYLNFSDLEKLSKSKNVSQALANQSKKVVMQKGAR